MNKKFQLTLIIAFLFIYQSQGFAQNAPAGTEIIYPIGIPDPENRLKIAPPPQRVHNYKMGRLIKLLNSNRKEFKAIIKYDDSLKQEMLPIDSLKIDLENIRGKDEWYFKFFTTSIEVIEDDYFIESVIAELIPLKDLVSCVSERQFLELTFVDLEFQRTYYASFKVENVQLRQMVHKWFNNLIKESQN